MKTNLKAKKTNNFSSHRWYEGNEPRIKPIGFGQPNKICTDNETVLFTFKFKQFLSRNHNNNKKNGNSLLYVRFYYCLLTTIMHNKYLLYTYGVYVWLFRQKKWILEYIRRLCNKKWSAWMASAVAMWLQASLVIWLRLVSVVEKIYVVIHDFMNTFRLISTGDRILHLMCITLYTDLF